MLYVLPRPGPFPGDKGRVSCSPPTEPPGHKEPAWKVPVGPMELGAPEEDGGAPDGQVRAVGRAGLYFLHVSCVTPHSCPPPMSQVPPPTPQLKVEVKKSRRHPLGRPPTRSPLSVVKQEASSDEGSCPAPFEGGPERAGRVPRGPRCHHESGVVSQSPGMGNTWDTFSAASPTCLSFRP